MIGLSAICTTNALNHLHAVLVEHHSDVIFVDFVGVYISKHREDLLHEVRIWKHTWLHKTNCTGVKPSSSFFEYILCLLLCLRVEERPFCLTVNHLTVDYKHCTDAPVEH